MSLWEMMVSIFWFMLLVAWFWLLIAIVTDIFRDGELSGWGKGLWCLFVIVFPWVGVLVYLIARGRTMQERSYSHSMREERRFREYVQDVAQPTGGIADELTKLAELRDRGAISEQDFAAAKSKLLADSMSPNPHRADAVG
jgi:hypothetical protein